MDYNKRLKELQEEIDELKNAQHNQGMEGAAKRIQKSLTREATVPELRFKDVAEKLGLNLKFQQRIDIFVGRRINCLFFSFTARFHASTYLNFLSILRTIAHPSISLSVTVDL